MTWEIVNSSPLYMINEEKKSKLYSFGSYVHHEDDTIKDFKSHGQFAYVLTDANGLYLPFGIYDADNGDRFINKFNKEEGYYDTYLSVFGNCGKVKSGIESYIVNGIARAQYSGKPLPAEIMEIGLVKNIPLDRGVNPNLYLQPKPITHITSETANFQEYFELIAEAIFKGRPKNTRRFIFHCPATDKEFIQHSPYPK